MNDIKLLRSIIVGEEVRIKTILEKWSIAKSDVDKILDSIAKIEETTIKLVIEKSKTDNYNKRFAGH